MSAKEKAVAINPDNNWGVKVRQGWAGLASAGGSLKESGVSFYDFSRIFQHTDRILYVDDCCHFNEEGNKILAKNLAEIVKDIL